MRLKFDVDGKDEEAWGGDFQTYDGPVPPKGSYVVKIKRITVGKIKALGDNHGKPRLSILLEVVGGSGSNGLNDIKYQYLGAPIWDGLNIIKPQAGRVNGFLHALTDGSDPAKNAVRNAFWPPNGPKADKVKRRDGTEDVHITDIGKYHIGSPDGNQLVRITTKMGKNLDGSDRAEVQSYLPYTGPRPGASANGHVDTDDDDLIDEVADEDDDDEVVSMDDIDEPEPVYYSGSDDEPPF